MPRLKVCIMQLRRSKCILQYEVFHVSGCNQPCNCGISKAYEEAGASSADRSHAYTEIRQHCDNLGQECRQEEARLFPARKFAR